MELERCMQTRGYSTASPVGDLVADADAPLIGEAEQGSRVGELL